MVGCRCGGGRGRGRGRRFRTYLSNPVLVRTTNVVVLLLLLAVVTFRVVEALAGTVQGLYRHAVKGLSADILSAVQLDVGQTFPDDRRYALLRQPQHLSEKINDGQQDNDNHNDKDQNSPPKVLFDPNNPEWLHKQNFLCAFSNPKFMAQFRSTYCHETKMLNLYHNHYSGTSQQPSTSHLPILQSVDLSTPSGRERLANFFTDQLRISCESDDETNPNHDQLVCVTAAGTADAPAASSCESTSNSHDQHKHQFGNTSSGWKRNKDTRTIHIINAATVRELSREIGIHINPTRLRPNLIVDGLDPWIEFDEWIGPASSSSSSATTTIQCGSDVQFDIIARTVRCQGVSIDPLEDPTNQHILDIPQLLTKHFPQYGPYLGVYAQVSRGGQINIGDQVQKLL